MDPHSILAAAKGVVVVDWPSKDVPVSLARAGLAVFVKGGPEPDHYSAYEVRDGEVTERRVGRAPASADIVYSHRPLDELPGIVDLALTLGATTIWAQSGLVAEGVDDAAGWWTPDDLSRQARAIVENAGLAYVDDTYIGDVARSLDRS